MKTINKYKYFLLLAVVSLFISCEQDDEVGVAPASTNIQVLVEAFVNSQIEVVGQGGTNNANIELGFRLTEYATTYNGSDIIIHYDGNEYVIEAGDSEVIVGTSNVEFEIEPPSGSIPYNGVSVSSTIDLDDSFEVEVVDRPNDLVVLKKGSVEVSARIYGQLPPVSPSAINFLFDWNPNHSAGNDLDLFLRNSGGDTIDFSWSVSNYEDVSLSNTELDDVYELFVDPWSTIGGTLSGILFAMHPDGTLEVFEMDLTGIYSLTQIVSIDKTTDMYGNVAYTISQD